MEEVKVILQYGQHMEKVCLAVANLRWQTVIIGHSWLAHHNPEVDWARQSVTWNRHSRGWVPAECLEQKMRGKLSSHFAQVLLYI